MGADLLALAERVRQAATAMAAATATRRRREDDIATAVAGERDAAQEFDRARSALLNAVLEGDSKGAS